MKKRPFFYSINVTLSPVEFSLYGPAVSQALARIKDVCSLLREVRATFFLDVQMLLHLQQKHPAEYERTQHELRALNRMGHDLAVYINMDWEQTQDLHYLDAEAVMDLFVHGKNEVMQITHPENAARQKTLASKLSQKDPPALAVRVSNGKLNPFVFLQDAYSFINVKLDASVPARCEATQFYNYKKISAGRVYRFADNPAAAHRFGKYLEVPRASYAAGALWKVRGGITLRRFGKEHGDESLSLFIAPGHTAREAAKIELPRVFRQKKYFFLSPDLITPERFLRSVEKAKVTGQDVVSAESFLSSVSQLTFRNLEALIHDDASFVTASALIKQYGLSTNNIALK